MAKFLESDAFLQFGVPLITVALSIFVKYVSRNDRYIGFRKEDLAVGMDIAVTALLIFITGSVQIANSAPLSNTTEKTMERVASVPWIILSFMLGMWGISTVVRKLGWKDEDKLHTFWGIIVPGIFGLTTLLLALGWVG